MIPIIDNTIKVRFYVSEDPIKQFKDEIIRCNDRIKEFREAAEILFNLSNPQKSRFLLERDGKYLKILNDYKTFVGEEVRENDSLVFCLFENLSDSIFFPGEQLVMYTLSLKVTGISPNPQYSIHLNSLCENNPKIHYFANSEINGRFKFEKFLKEKLQKNLNQEEIEKIIDFWCNDICQGFQTTTLSL